jgi:hypothetical protein
MMSLGCGRINRRLHGLNRRHERGIGLLCSSDEFAQPHAKGVDVGLV